MGLKVPESLRLEHARFRKQLCALTKDKTDFAVAVQAVTVLFDKHSIKEETKIFPVLEVLPLLAERKTNDSMKLLQSVADEMKAGLHEELLEEHRTIVESLRGISQSAMAQNRREYVDFAECFILHTKMEEEMLYHAALVTADDLQLLNQCRISSNGYFL